jgi:hypothetical protein
MTGLQFTYTRGSMTHPDDYGIVSTAIRGIAWWAGLTVAVQVVVGISFAVAYFTGLKGLLQLDAFVAACWFFSLLLKRGIDHRRSRDYFKPTKIP